MWRELQSEVDAFKRSCFSPKYLNLRDRLEGDLRAQFIGMENLFLDLISFVATAQKTDGWWPGAYEKILTAHAVRILHKIGIPFQARWNLRGSKGQGEGGLARATKQLLDSIDPDGPEPTKSFWSEDFWDDCYVLLALFEVSSDLDLDADMKEDFRGKYARSRDLLAQHVANKLALFTEDEWFGPAQHAAGIELFDYLATKQDYSDGGRIVDQLAELVEPMLQEAVNTGTVPEWDDKFAWHVGQFLVTWKEKESRYAKLGSLAPLANDLFDLLLKRQHGQGHRNEGAWPSKTVVDRIYFSVRALAALYAWGEEQSVNAQRAHAYLLGFARGARDAPLRDIKGCVNALDALQQLFGFSLQVYPTVFFSLTARLDFLKLSDSVLRPARPGVGMLNAVRTAARIELENRGEYRAELVGVNGRLYENLKRNKDFLDQFITEPEQTRAELERFLASTLTETRCNSSQKLIKHLWSKQGFLNFIPFIHHLSLLEQDRVFYKYYRDHLNHEILLFLLGSYIYFNCSSFRGKIDEEISRKSPDGKLDERHLAAEFLFRWKLISTFHDIGYLFEIDPDNDVPSSTGKTKKRLLDSSFTVVEKVRGRFFYDYFMQHADTAEQKEKARALIKAARARIAGPKYKPAIRDQDGLRTLSTSETYRDTFKLISRYVTSEHIPEDLIERYFELCRGTDVTTRKRSRFLDHGIMSALVLLKTADIQRYYLKQLTDLKFLGELADFPELRSILSNADTKGHLDEDRFFTRFSHVAGAIALHNIYPTLYTPEECAALDAQKPEGVQLKEAFYCGPIGTKGRYAITMDENPLAYLTSMADALQDWDRHSFRRMAFAEQHEDFPLSASEVVIESKEDEVNGETLSKIHVLPLSANAKDHYHHLGFNQYLLDWDRYLAVEGSKESEEERNVTR